MEQLRFKALYYPESMMWIIVDSKTGAQIVYHLNQVETDTVMYCAHVFNLLEWSVKWEHLQDEQKKNLLDWFENEVFPTEFFGKMILSDIYEELKGG